MSVYSMGVDVASHRDCSYVVLDEQLGSVMAGWVPRGSTPTQTEPVTESLAAIGGGLAG